MALIIKYLKKLSPNQYFQEARKKISVFLHHTAGGGALEAINWWEQTPDRVGTALLVERDGTAYQCFEIEDWAYHLGPIPGATGKTTRESVGIEIVSYGFLFPEGEGENRKFYAYPAWPSKTRKVLISNDNVVELKEPWRGFKFYHKYTDAQVKTIVELLRYLVNRFNIKVQDDLTNFWDYRVEVMTKDLPGIWSHTTVRKDKSDIFPQPNLLEAIYKEFKTPSKDPKPKS